MFSFQSLLLLNMLSHQAFVLALSRIIQIFDRAIVLSDKMWIQSTMFPLPCWFLRNIALPKTAWTCDRTRRLPATAINGHQYDYDFGLLDCWIRHFSSTANLKYRWRANIRIRGKSVYLTRLSGFKSFRIQSSHCRFGIQNLQRHH